jgi:hypothetical protein
MARAGVLMDLSFGLEGFEHGFGMTGHTHLTPFFSQNTFRIQQKSAAFYTHVSPSVQFFFMDDSKLFAQQFFGV